MNVVGGEARDPGEADKVRTDVVAPGVIDPGLYEVAVTPGGSPVTADVDSNTASAVPEVTVPLTV
jgi:hypothetical protein